MTSINGDNDDNYDDDDDDNDNDDDDGSRASDGERMQRAFVSEFFEDPVLAYITQRRVLRCLVQINETLTGEDHMKNIYSKISTSVVLAL